MRQDVQVIESMFSSHREHDPAWTYTDKGGHYHCAVTSDSGVAHPTLLVVCEEEGWCDICCDFHDGRTFISHYECRFCRETIKPGHITVPNKPAYIEGPREWTREGTLWVTEQEAQRMMAADEITNIYGGLGNRGYMQVTVRQVLEEWQAQALIKGGPLVRILPRGGDW